jgi:diacylglycerol O-acyltransferase-1
VLPFLPLVWLYQLLTPPPGNSESLGVYWRTWNKPVYQFFRRHVYSPMRSRGWSHMTASTAVFFVSAVLHELLVGVPTHNLIGK